MANACKRRSRLAFAVLLCLTIGTASSKYAYSQAEVPIVARAPVETTVDPGATLEGRTDLPTGDGSARGDDISGPPAGVAILQAAGPTEADLIRTISDYFSGDNAHLTQILLELGFSPAASSADMWKNFPATRKIATAYRAAQAAGSNPGGGNDFLVYLIHRLNDTYESIRYDDDLKRFLETPLNQSIKFAAIDVSPLPIISLPESLKRVISDIVRYCEKCTVLGGIQGILETYLGLGVPNAFDILSTSRSDAEALERAASGLSPTQVITRLQIVVNILQDNYGPASNDHTLSDFSAWQIQ